MFFEIFKQYGLNEYVDGIMGMSRKWDDKKYKTGPLYIEYLYLSGMIAERIFSVNLASLG